MNEPLWFHSKQQKQKKPSTRLSDYCWQRTDVHTTESNKQEIDHQNAQIQYTNTVIESRN
eukprot:m.39501 g.39501  ORF g.39501 m.39501 type:complete len:60 (-) comp11613_c0_seq1:1141-1320(-)